MSDQKNLTDIYRLFYLKAGKYTFTSSAHRTFPKVYHKIGHNNKSKFIKIEIIFSIFSEHNGIKLEINYIKKTGSCRA